MLRSFELIRCVILVSLAQFNRNIDNDIEGGLIVLYIEQLPSDLITEGEVG